MSSATTNPQGKKKKEETQFPPRRGQIKAQIFESMVKTVVSVALKAKEAPGKKYKGDGSDGKSTSSATTTPPQSGYNSEGNGDNIS